MDNVMYTTEITTDDGKRYVEVTIKNGDNIQKFTEGCPETSDYYNIATAVLEIALCGKILNAGQSVVKEIKFTGINASEMLEATGNWFRKLLGKLKTPIESENPFQAGINSINETKSELGPTAEAIQNGLSKAEKILQDQQNILNKEGNLGLGNKFDSKKLWGLLGLGLGLLFPGLFHAAQATQAIKIDPLLLDLDGDGIETTTVTNGVYFDHDKNGFAQESAWVGSDDGVLVIDKNNNGTIDDGGEIFGDSYILKDGTTATTGFQALADLDSNGNEIIDSSDTQFANLKILKGDGSCQTLAEAGIQSFNLANTSTNIKQRLKRCA